MVPRFLVDHVGEGATLVTDGLQTYRQATKDGCTHRRLVVPRQEAGNLLPGVHRVDCANDRPGDRCWVRHPSDMASRIVAFGPATSALSPTLT